MLLPKVPRGAICSAGMILLSRNVKGSKMTGENGIFSSIGMGVTAVLFWFNRLAYAILGMLGILAAVVAVVSVWVFIIAGLWDLLVWLTNADWKTTNFSAPIWAGIIAAATGVSAWVLVGAGDWFDEISDQFRPPEKQTLDGSGESEG